MSLKKNGGIQFNAGGFVQATQNMKQQMNQLNQNMQFHLNLPLQGSGLLVSTPSQSSPTIGTEWQRINWVDQGHGFCCELCAPKNNGMRCKHIIKFYKENQDVGRWVTIPREVREGNGTKVSFFELPVMPSLGLYTRIFAEMIDDYAVHLLSDWKTTEEVYLDLGVARMYHESMMNLRDRLIDRMKHVIELKTLECRSKLTCQYKEFKITDALYIVSGGDCQECSAHISMGATYLDEFINSLND